MQFFVTCGFAMYVMMLGVSHIFAWLYRDTVIIWITQLPRVKLADLCGTFILAILWRGLFARSGLNLAEVFVFGLYVMAMGSVLSLLVSILAALLPLPVPSYRTVPIAIDVVATFIYVAVAGRYFIRAPLLPAVLKLLVSFAVAIGALAPGVQLTRL